MAIPEIQVNAWLINRRGDKLVVTVGSSDAKTIRLIIGVNQAFDFSVKIAELLESGEAAFE